MANNFKFESTSDGPIVDGASASVLRSLLSELEGEVDAAGLSFREHFRPGKTRAELVDRFERAGLRLGEEVAAWFEWQDGPIGDLAPAIIPNSIPIGADRSLAISQRFREQLSATDRSQLGLDDGWLQLNMQSNGLIVESGGGAGPPRIRYSNPDFGFEPNSYRAVSLCTWVAWRLYGIRSGGYRWEAEQRMWVTDESRLHPIQVSNDFW